MRLMRNLRPRRYSGQSRQRADSSQTQMERSDDDLCLPLAFRHPRARSLKRTDDFWKDLLLNNLPLIYQAKVVEDWIDYNGHLRDAFYFLLFSHATDALMEHIGLDAQGRAQHRHTLYTLEAHINYLSEAKLGDQVQVFTQLVDHDNKRLHIVHHLYRPFDGELLAASEQMLMNISAEAGRAAKFSGPVEEQITLIFGSHQSLPRPGYCSRVIGIRR